MALRHGHAAGGGTRTFHAWKSMLQRCGNASRADWSRYGGRRIGVCERWYSFDNFLADMGPCPERLTLDRIDNNGNYEPGNCRWTTWEQQVRNRRPNSGELHPNAKLTVDDVVEIRRLSRRGVTQRRLGTRFGVSGANVGYIVRGQAWRHPTRAGEGNGRVIEL